MAGALLRRGTELAYRVRPRTRGIVTYVVAALACAGIAWGAPTIVTLHDIDSGTTSPTGAYRWLDIANQPYGSSYQNAYNYTQASVQVNYGFVGTVFRGTLTAGKLKPNFAYQLKLIGTPGTESNEGIGLAGRWWQETWNSSAWAGGQNLNNKGDGSSPSPNDLLYLDRRDQPDPTSPTGRRYRYTAYLVLDYFITDERGDARLDFRADSSYHVLWKTTQRTRTASDGPLKSHTFDPDPAQHPAYSTDYLESSVSVFGEWERLPVGGVFLRPGDYACQVMLTEESFHGRTGLSGNWAAAMGGQVQFTIVEEPDAVSIPEAKLLPDGSVVKLVGKAVTAAGNDWFYVEEDSRVSGIRVEMPAHVLEQGMRADVTGTMETNSEGERYVWGCSVAQSGPT